jgi:hypothetical protein
MIPEESREYFTPERPGGLIKRGFRIARNSFTASYLSKGLSMIMVILISLLTTKLIDFILRNVEIDPRILIIIIIGIMIVSSFIVYFVRLTAEGIIYHAQARSITGKRANTSSIRYGMRKNLQWALLAMTLLSIQIVYVILLVLLNRFGGELAVQVAIWTFNILIVLASPFIYLVYPYMVMEKLNFRQALSKSINMGMKSYRKLLVVNLIIHLVFFVVGYLFSMLFNTISGYIYLGESSLIIQFVQIFRGLGSSPLYYLYMFIYISVISSLYVIASAIRAGICASLMGNGEEIETAYNKVKSSIEED